MKTSEELREVRASIVEDQHKLYEAAEKEDRELNSDELEKFDKLEKEFDRLEEEIRSVEAEEERRAKVAERLRSYADTDHGSEQAKEDRNVIFEQFLRSKHGPSEVRALEVGTDSEGGYLVPDEFMRKLVEAKQAANIMRSLCTVIRTSSGTMDIPVVASQGAADWTDEEGAYNESDDAFTRVQLSAYKLTRLIKVSEELMADSAFDMQGYLATSFGRAFGVAEEAAFISGNGTLKPTGILSGAAAGVTAASATAITADEIIDLYHSVAEQYRPNAAFMMKDSTVKLLRKLKTGEGQYIWQPGLVAGQPDRLMGRPMYTSSSMPAATTGLEAVLFADFSYYYIADRVGQSFKRLNELYAATGQVGFVGSQRVDGKLTLAAAAKTLTMA